MNTVLIADRDLGFVFWLGQALGQLGYQVLPATHVAQAANYAEQFRVDLLILNPALPKILALVKSLQDSQTDLKILAIPPRLEERLDKFRDPLIALEEAQDSAVFLSEHAVVAPQTMGQDVVASGLSGARAALTGLIVGAFLWAALLVLIVPR